MTKILTVGVYDILHIGHMLLFKHAKEYGDYLIVAVQESGYILKYKPNADVFYNTEERMFMVNSLRYVDEVITYKDVDEIVREVDFDVFAVGPDQNHFGFQRAIEWCKANNKEVVVIPRTDGVSSTLLRDYLSD